jgi:hypothetical protein
MLTFIHQDGCPVCAATKPAVKRFKERHPEIPVEDIEITNAVWPEGAWAPDAVPTFVLRTRHDKRGKFRVGQMSLAELEAWAGTPVKP